MRKIYFEKPLVIPTPRYASYSGKRLLFDGLKLEHAELAAPYALQLLQPLCRATTAEEVLLFEPMQHANPQAYEIKIKHKRILVRGASREAFIYAASTLLQLTKSEKSQIAVTEGEILDFPEFAHRGVNWNLLVECRGWSQDSGEGRQKLIDNCCDAFDLLVSFKLNTVMIDGFGWNPERFPGYSDLMRKINHEARRRGIKLIFGGYNAGYGAQWHDFDGPVFHNRKQYPDGEEYQCIGSQEPTSICRTMGTCLSNPALNQLKQQNLEEFVRAVEPGMLYIHGLDISAQSQALQGWNQRCSQCRCQWPNDDINAADGMAGAFANFYDQLYEAIVKVRNPSSNYDAARDCTVLMVSPNYTKYYESDDDWHFHLEYFKVLTACLKHKEIQLVLREQFFGEKNSLPRFKQLRQAVGEHCKLATFFFSSGSGFYNSLPVTADAACIRYFSGLDTVIAGSGNAFQETRQAILAEYLWNPMGSPWQIGLPEESNMNDFLPLYKTLCDGRNLPEAIFCENGLLQQVCTRLYGKEASTLVAMAQKPQPHPYFEPKSMDKPAALAAVFPLHNELLAGFTFSVYKKKGDRKIFWHSQLNLDALQLAADYASLLPRLTEITHTAAGLFQQASLCCQPDYPLKQANRQAHLRRLSETCHESIKLLEFTRQWLLLLISAWAAKDKPRIEKIKIVSEINTMLDELHRHDLELQKLTIQMTDPSGGDISQGQRTIKFIQQELHNIQETLESGTFPPSKPANWW